MELAELDERGLLLAQLRVALDIVGRVRRRCE
jgi:hypothetical protein